MSGAGLLRIEGLGVTIDTPAGPVAALSEVSLAVAAGEVVGLVGESGGGKSMIARTLIRQLPARARATGRVMLGGTDVLALEGAALRRHRGHGVALCFQTPRSSLHPTRTVGRQLADRLATHRGLDAAAARTAALALFRDVGLRTPERQLDRFPHELSGGMCQRVMIALALACAPRLLVADEPTTGLDVTLTGEILRLIAAQARPGDSGTGRGVIVISHDLAALAPVCDRLVVLEAGRVVETGPTAEVLHAPRHPYTARLIAAVPDIDRRRATAPRDAAPVVLAMEGVAVRYGGRFGRGGETVLDGIDFALRQGETLGIVGESGSGKTTLSRAAMGLLRPSSGRVLFEGTDLATLSRARLRRLRTRMQMVFQDPVDSLNPAMRVDDILSDPLRLAGLDRRARAERIDRVLVDVGLGPAFRRRYPAELSGGQAQRVGIARALVIDPAMVVLDEPTSALDVTVQAQILDLIRALTARRDRAYMMVSHDLATVRSICDRVMVLDAGRIVEIGPTEEVFTRPQSPVTRALLAAAPRLDPAGRRAAPHEPERTTHAV